MTLRGIPPAVDAAQCLRQSSAGLATKPRAAALYVAFYLVNQLSFEHLSDQAGLAPASSI